MEKVRITNDEMKACWELNGMCFQRFRYLTQKQGLIYYDENLDIATEISEEGDILLWNVPAKNPPRRVKP